METDIGSHDLSKIPSGTSPEHSRLWQKVSGWREELPVTRTPKLRESFRKAAAAVFFFFSFLLPTKGANVLPLFSAAHVSCLLTTVRSNKRSGISPVRRVLSRGPGAATRLHRSHYDLLGPTSAGIKLCAQSSRKGGQGPNGGWGTGQ